MNREYGRRLDNKEISIDESHWPLDSDSDKLWRGTEEFLPRLLLG